MAWSKTPPPDGMSEEIRSYLEEIAPLPKRDGRARTRPRTRPKANPWWVSATGTAAPRRPAGADRATPHIRISAKLRNKRVVHLPIGDGPEYHV